MINSPDIDDAFDFGDHNRPEPADRLASVLRGELKASPNRRALFSVVSSAKVIIIIATAPCQ